jgi:hypothetical protein
VSHWLVDHPGPDFTSTGCGYFFYDHARYLSSSMAWRCDGRVMWEDAITQDGRLLPEQRLPKPNATVGKDGKLVGGLGSTNRGRCLREHAASYGPVVARHP